MFCYAETRVHCGGELETTSRATAGVPVTKCVKHIGDKAGK
jgi:hypothetical protein